MLRIPSSSNSLVRYSMLLSVSYRDICIGEDGLVVVLRLFWRTRMVKTSGNCWRSLSRSVGWLLLNFMQNVKDRP